MAKEEHTYQPGWGEKKHHHHHHHYEPNHKNRGMGGALRMRDKQAYVGLMLVIIGALAFGGYKLADLFAEEIRQMPKDNPSKESGRLGYPYGGRSGGPARRRQYRQRVETGYRS